MADVVANLRIQAVGADAAAAAAQKTAEGLNNISASSSRLEEKFSHRFSHVGLQLFAADALRASGLGMETRQIIGTLNMAVTSMGAAFGAAAVPIMLIGTALIAGIGIFQKVNEKHEETATNLKKLNDEQEKNRVSLQGEIDNLQSYKDELGYLPPAIDNLLSAKIRLRRFEDQEEIKSLEKQISATQALMQEEKKHGAELLEQQKIVHGFSDAEIESGKAAGVLKTAYTLMTSGFKDFNKAITENDSALEKNQTSLAEAKVRLDAAKSGTGDWEKALKKLSDQHHKAAEDAEKMGDAEAKAVDKAKSGIQSLYDREKEYELGAVSVHADSIAQKNKKTDEWLDYQINKIDELYNKEEKNILENIQDETTRYQMLAQLNDQYSATVEAAENEHSSKLITATKERDKKITDMERKVGDEMAGAFGQSVAKMIVEGKSFTDSMMQAFSQMAEQIIADIIRIEIEMMVLNSMGGGAGGLGSIFHAAEGVQFVASSPTPLLVGEGGQPELVTVTPFSKLGQGQQTTDQGTTVINVGSITTNVTGVNDPDRIADQVGMKIVQRIRGRGDISFSRSF